MESRGFISQETWGVDDAGGSCGLWSNTYFCYFTNPFTLFLESFNVYSRYPRPHLTDRWVVVGRWLREEIWGDSILIQLTREVDDNNVKCWKHIVFMQDNKCFGFIRVIPMQIYTRATLLYVHENTCYPLTLLVFYFFIYFSLCFFLRLFESTL